jgi:tetratricopeptide (TPR) repeat protein
MTQDTKMIIGVGALVIAGAAGLALLGGLSAQREVGQSASATTRYTQAVPASLPEIEDATGITTAGIQETHLEEIAPQLSFAEEAPEIEQKSCDPLDGTGRIARGLTHWEARAFDLAAVCFDEEVRGGSERPWVHYMSGLSFWKAGQLDQAAEAMESAAGLDAESIKTFINLSRIRNDRGEYERALAAAREALRIDPQDPTAVFLEGRSLRNMGVRNEALDALQRSIDLDPSNGYAQNMLGLTLLEADREREALSFLTTAAGLEPEISYIQNNLGMAHERCGNRDEAIVAYHKAAELDGGAGSAAMNLARLDPEGLFRPDVVVAELLPETDQEEIETVETAKSESGISPVNKP